MYLRKAFTLVELLVILSIIGILIGLLLPAINAARKASNQQDFKLDDKVQIIDGFFEGLSGRVVDKIDYDSYTVDIGERHIEVDADEMKIK